MRYLTIGSLFSGIGGFELGLEWAGFGPVKWQVEIDDYATKVLEKHWPDVKRYRDIRDCGKHNMEPVGLICGGFPCQDISAAGKKKGIKKETRSGLWFQFKRIISEIRPQIALIENVPAILDYPSMHTVLCDLAEIGYNARWENISAEEVGLSHIRERIFIIAYPSSIRGNTFKQIIFKKNRNMGNSIISDGENYGDCIKSFWETKATEGKIQFKPILYRSDNGIPFDVDRLKCLGNAVVPQVSQAIGEILMEWIKLK